MLQTWLLNALALLDQQMLYNRKTGKSSRFNCAISTNKYFQSYGGMTIFRTTKENENWFEKSGVKLPRPTERRGLKN